MDEAMVKFKGHSLLKQCIPKKPYGVDVTNTMGLHVISKFTWEPLMYQKRTLGLGPF